MERDYDDAEIYHYKTNFNSHAHVERDPILFGMNRCTEISTHTLTWSVTKDWRHAQRIVQISTHTLTWSVTGEKYEISSTWEISTHTLTWSVTFSSI